MKIVLKTALENEFWKLFYDVLWNKHLVGK